MFAKLIKSLWLMIKMFMKNLMGMLILAYWLINISLSTKVVRMGITCSKTEF